MADKLLCIFMLPTRMNDGTAVPPSQIDEYFDELVAVFGGATMEGIVTIEGIVRGGWRDDATGRQYRDDSLKVRVAIDDSGLPELEGFLRRVGRELEQEAMFLEIHHADIRLIRP